MPDKYIDTTVGDCRDRATETGATFTIEQERTAGLTTDSDIYRVRAGADESPLDSTTVTARYARVENRLHKGVSIIVPGDTDVSIVSVDTPERQHTLVLSSDEFTADCQAAAEGDRTAAERLTRTPIPPARLPLVCGAVLSVSDVVGLTDAVAATSHSAAGQLHDYRYGVVRGALCHDAGLTVTTRAELETLVEGLDAVDRVGDVELVPALADVMATVHDDPTQTRTLLAEVGFDCLAVERRDDGLLFACRLAQLLQSRGIEAARAEARTRDWWLDGTYSQRLSHAKSAAYGARGRTWRRLVSLAARRDDDTFAFVLANALYWSGHEDRTDTRLSELLYGGAVIAGGAVDLDTLVHRAIYSRHVAAGHRHRSKACAPPAVAHFTTAAHVADTQTDLPSWDPRYSRAIARANGAAGAGEHATAVDILDDAYETLSAYDIPEAKGDDVRHHLVARRLEAEAACADTPTAAVEALNAAQDHYATVGFDRSVDRVERALDRQRTRATSVTRGSEQSTATPPQQDDTTAASHDSRSTASSPEAQDASRGADTSPETTTPAKPSDASVDDTEAGGESTVDDATGEGTDDRRGADDDPIAESPVLDPTGGDPAIHPGGGDIWADPDDPADSPWDDKDDEGDPYLF